MGIISRDFETSERYMKLNMSPEEWLTYLEENFAFGSLEIKAVVQSLNLESLEGSRRIISILNGSIFEPRQIIPSASIDEARKRGYKKPGGEIICPLFKLLLKDKILFSLFKYFVIVGEVFEDERGEYYLAISTGEGYPLIVKYYKTPAINSFSVGFNAYLFEK